MTTVDTPLRVGLWLVAGVVLAAGVFLAGVLLAVPLAHLAAHLNTL